MKFFQDFLRQKAPRPGREMPEYYRNALAVTENILAAYFFIVILLFRWSCLRWSPVPIVLLGCLLLLRYCLGDFNMRVSYWTFCAVGVGWCWWYIVSFGWGYGGQNLLIPLLTLCYFNICEPPQMKLGCSLGLGACRLLLFLYSHSHAPLYALAPRPAVLFQTLSSATLLLSLSLLYILFSLGAQSAERQLRLDNQELSLQAGTDPLTQLPNRRAMLDEMDLFLANSPEENYCVAMADIDFFKKVNDTYGHSCGDYALQQLSALFRASIDPDCRVCRWGGEEFCFFLPGRNLDAAGFVMQDLCGKVKKLPLSFGGVDFSITVTIGVAENDFASPVQAIIDQADQKLYIGKLGGRNQVVM